jgi:hypothetical protein
MNPAGLNPGDIIVLKEKVNVEYGEGNQDDNGKEITGMFYQFSVHKNQYKLIWDYDGRGTTFGWISIDEIERVHRRYQIIDFAMKKNDWGKEFFIGQYAPVMLNIQADGYNQFESSECHDPRDFELFEIPVYSNMIKYVLIDEPVKIKEFDLSYFERDYKSPFWGTHYKMKKDINNSTKDYFKEFECYNPQ